MNNYTALHQLLTITALIVFLIACGKEDEVRVSLEANRRLLTFNTGRGVTDSRSTNIGFVIQLYTRFFRRYPSASEAWFWVGRLNQLSRSQVASVFVDSPEGRSVLVGSAYQQFLGRAPEPGALRYWVSIDPRHLNGNQAPYAEFLFGKIIQSSEYLLRYGIPLDFLASDLATMTTRYYQSVLGRVATADELNLQVLLEGYQRNRFLTPSQYLILTGSSPFFYHPHPQSSGPSNFTISALHTVANSFGRSIRSIEISRVDFERFLQTLPTNREQSPIREYLVKILSEL